MGQTVQAWRSGNGERLWLSMLVETMGAVSRSELRGVASDPSILIALRAQLARPPSTSTIGASRYSLRN